MSKKKAKCSQCKARMYIEKHDKKKEIRPICSECYRKSIGADVVGYT